MRTKGIRRMSNEQVEHEGESGRMKLFGSFTVKNARPPPPVVVVAV